MAAVLSASIAFLRRAAGALTLAFLALVTTSVALPARAEPIRFPAEPFSYVVIRQDIRGFMREYAAWAGVFLNLDRSVQGMVDGPLPALPPEALLDRVTSEHGLYWWFDGAVLHVGPTADIATASIPLPTDRADSALSALERLAIVEPRYPVRIDAELGLASATGPKAYVKKVSEALEAAVAEAGAPEGRSDWRTVTIVRNGRRVEVSAPRGRTTGAPR